MISSSSSSSSSKTTTKKGNKRWYHKRLADLAKIDGYIKPEKLDALTGGSSTTPTTGLKLDSNENFIIAKKFQQDLLTHTKQHCDIRQYPLGQTDKLLTALSKYLKVPPNMIGLGNGSDQILDILLCHLAANPNLPSTRNSNTTTKTKKRSITVLTSNPTFTFFEQRCSLYGVPTIKIPFSDTMQLDPKQFHQNLSKAQILYLDSPNNPTGFQFSNTQIESLTKKFNGLVIIDEAYSEFADSTAVPLTKKYDNLIVVKTFSKAFGLAGLRLGYFVANKTFVDIFTRILQYPYPINTIAIEAATLSLSKLRPIQDAINTTKSERKRIIQNLRKYSTFAVFDSKANFVLFDAGGANTRIHTALIEQGISIRRLGKIGTTSHKGCLRVTVGTKEMNSKFLLAIRDLLG